MKTKIAFSLWAVALWASVGARAERLGFGNESLRSLQWEASELQQAVRYYGLHQATQAVMRFNLEVDALVECEMQDPIIGVPGHGHGGIGRPGRPGPGGGGPIIVDPSHPGGGGPIIVDPNDPFGPGGGGNSFCRVQLQQTQLAFSQVERSLRNVGFQYPDLARQLQQVRQALQDVAFGGGGGIGPFPPVQNYVCTAQDNGWEEHFGGHVGYGPNVQQAQRQALYECQRTHGTCRIVRCDLAR